MKFTKEYIKECDCKEIQGLKKEIEFGDFFTYTPEYTLGSQTIHVRSDHFDAMKLENKKGYTIWLPNGDQLDDEIVKIISIKSLTYNISYKKNRILEYYTEIHDDSYHGDGNADYYTLHSTHNNNPLIAKIKLLKELLNG